MLFAKNLLELVAPTQSFKMQLVIKEHATRISYILWALHIVLEQFDAYECKHVHIFVVLHL